MQATINADRTSAYAVGLTRLNWYDVAVQTITVVLFWWGGSYAALYINPLLVGILDLPPFIGFSAAALIFGLCGLIGTIVGLRTVLSFRAGLVTVVVWSATTLVYFSLIDYLSLEFSLLIVQLGLAIAGVLTGLTLGITLSRKIPDFSRLQAGLLGIAWTLALLLYTPAVNALGVESAPFFGIVLGGLVMSLVGSGMVFAQVKIALSGALPKLSKGMEWLFNPIAAPGTPLVVTEEEFDEPKRKRKPRPLGINWQRHLRLAGVGLGTMLLVVGIIRVVMPVRTVLVDPPAIPFANNADAPPAVINNISNNNLQGASVEQIYNPLVPIAPEEQDVLPYYVSLYPQYHFDSNGTYWVAPGGARIHALSQGANGIIFDAVFKNSNDAQLTLPSAFVARGQMAYAPGLDGDGINIRSLAGRPIVPGALWIGTPVQAWDWELQYSTVAIVKSWLGVGGWMYLVEDANGARMTVHQTQLIYKPWI